MRWMHWLLLGAVWVGAGWEARAQGASRGPALPPWHTLRSLSPTDTTFAELEFLRAEIGEARVVFLGEPTHGEGNVLAAKARLVAFLQQQMGFTTLGLESGFFELHRAQQGIAAGKSVSKNLASSVFPVWMRTQEFQAVLPLVGPAGLKVMGFDPQLSGDYSDDLVDDLDDFLEKENGHEAISYDLLGGVVGFMAAHYRFPPTRQIADFEGELAKADKLLGRIAIAPAAARRTEALFWQQCLRSLGALARDYAAHTPDAKIAAEQTAADSNPRDAQMADNLLWYMRQHPTEKVICWGALPHFANRVEALGNEELRAYQPMGRAVKAALGAEQVYVLGTLAGGGTHGQPGGAAAPVPGPAAGTLEASLLAQNVPYAFVSLKHDAPGVQLTTYAFDYQPLAGPWSEVVDGFLFLRSVNPPHLTGADSSAVAAAPPDTAATGAGSLSPAPGRGGATVRRVVAVPDVSGVRRVRGVVLDQRSRQPVPYASVQLPGQGTMADGKGRFELALPGPTRLQISSLGYTTATVQSPRGSEELTVLLAVAAYALAEVRVVSAPLDPLLIMKQVIKNIPANYEQKDYATEVYAHRRFSNFDTVRYEAETVSRLRVPAGYRHFAGGTLMLEEGPEVQVQQQHVVVRRDSLQPDVRLGAIQGFTPGTADPVRISPLFVARNLHKFTLKLDSTRQQGDETLYVLSFAAQQANQRSTGTYLMAVYQGRLLVRQRDHAVLHYEAIWQLDTAAYNSTARENAGRRTLVAQLYPLVFTADRSTHVADYAKGPSGRYYTRRSIGQSQSAGRVLGRQPFYRQTLAEQYFQPLPKAGVRPAKGSPAGEEEPASGEVPYRPAFWESYQRPEGLAAPQAQP